MHRHKCISQIKSGGVQRVQRMQQRARKKEQQRRKEQSKSKTTDHKATIIKKKKKKKKSKKYKTPIKTKKCISGSLDDKTK